LGSVARGDADRHSDLDLLAVVEDDAAVGERLRRVVPRVIDGRSVQIRILTVSRLEELAARRTIYGAHVALESLHLFDRRGDLRRLQRAFPPGATLAESAEPLRRRLALYDDLDWCGGHFLLCLADLYAFGRAGAILTLGRRGIFEFGRTAPLERLSTLDPANAVAAATIRDLEPFYVRVRRGMDVATPFPARGAFHEAAAARDACKAILAPLP
jgi:Nucleotidyltransferase domain